MQHFNKNAVLNADCNSKCSISIVNAVLANHNNKLLQNCNDKINVAIIIAIISAVLQYYYCRNTIINAVLQE